MQKPFPYKLPFPRINTQLFNLTYPYHYEDCALLSESINKFRFEKLAPPIFGLISQYWVNSFYQNQSFPPNPINHDVLVLDPDVISQYILRREDRTQGLIYNHNLRNEDISKIEPELLNYLVNKFGGFRLVRDIRTSNNNEIIPFRIRVIEMTKEFRSQIKKKTFLLSSVFFFYLQVFPSTQISEIHSDIFLHLKSRFPGQFPFENIMLYKLNDPSKKELESYTDGSLLPPDQTIKDAGLLSEFYIIVDLKFDNDWTFSIPIPTPPPPVSPVPPVLPVLPVAPAAPVLAAPVPAPVASAPAAPAPAAPAPAPAAPAPAAAAPVAPAPAVSAPTPPPASNPLKRKLTLEHEEVVNEPRKLRNLRRIPNLSYNLEEESLKYEESLKNSNNNIHRGLIGLQNMNNSCYMNAALQCLSHTQELKDYFLNLAFNADLNKENPLGTKGDSAFCMSILIRRLWLEKISCFAPFFMKTLFNKHSTLNMYAQEEQHDSQEFLQTFLDMLHEDLNRVKTLSQEKNNRNTEEGKTDLESAKSSFKNYLIKNQSVIVELFFGILKSEVKCPECKKANSKFDLFLCLSLPIPAFNQKNDRKIVLFRETQEGGLMKPFQIEINSFLMNEVSLGEVREKVKNSLSPKPNSLSFFELSDYCFRLIEKSDSLLIKEVFSDNRPLLSLIELDRDVEYTYVNVKIQGIKLPRLVRISTKTNWRNFIVVIDTFLERFFKLGSLETKSNKTIEFKEYRRLALKFFCFKRNKFFCVKCSKNVECKCKIDFPGNYAGVEAHYRNYAVFVEVRFGKEFYKKLDKKILNWFREEHTKIHIDWKNPKQLKETSIYDCLKQFKEVETLCSENLWFCDGCKKNQCATTQIEIYSPPKILIVHFKRFKTEKNTKTKINNRINFPLEELDLSDYIVNHNSPLDLVKEGKGKLKRNKILYDLYAVIYHHGTSLSHGHYTASCRHDEKGKWYKFDDKLVMEERIGNICNNDAYVLFYRRREH